MAPATSVQASGGADSSLFSGVAPPQRAGAFWKRNSQLPLVPCGICGEVVVERVSRTAAHPDRVFYRCVNCRETGNQCRFFKWQDEYAVWLVDEGYLWCPGDDMALVKSSVERVGADMDHVRTCMTSMVDTLKNIYLELKDQQQALRVSMARNTAMAVANSSMIERKLALNAVFVAVILVFIVVVLMK
ncbi:hypothetical protein ACP4OV_004535 [Aristida adscensionis]